MKLVSTRMAVSAFICMVILSSGCPCSAQTQAGKGMKFANENTVTLKGIARAVPDTAGSATKHLEMTAGGITYRLKSDMLTQADVKHCDGYSFTATGTVRSSNDKVRVLDVISYEYESSTSSPASASERSNESSTAAGKQPPILGNWNVFYPDGRLCDQSLRIFHPDGRFEVTGLPQWNGTYQFTNPDKTQLKITCNNGRVLTLDYKKESDSMVENTGAIFRRAKKQDNTGAPSLTVSNKAVASPAPAVTAATWYKLDADKTYQADYTLKPGESKSLEITAASRSSIKVGFESDLKPGQMEQMQKEGAHDPIMLSTRDGKESIASFYGGATTFAAKNGKLAMKVQNSAKVSVKVVIYTEAQ